MKKKNLIFLFLVLGIVLFSGCTNSKSGSFRSRGLLGGILAFIEGWLQFVLGVTIYNVILNIFIGFFSLGIALFIMFVLIILLPYISAFLIVYGFLNELRIFRYKPWINIVLAFTMTTSVMFVPIPIFGFALFTLLVRFLFSAMTAWSIILFTLMFFVGTIYLFKIRRSKWGTSAGVYAAYKQEARSLGAELESINTSLSQAMAKMANETDPNKRAALERSVQELTDRRRDLSERIKELEETSRRL
ncbi:MAG: hypothetical protein GF368_03300 [Candidatus Aenigmarchaeota archaeon]|nr:hypothetical protein [Candidatus Aenigmarchaeota archaeon]